MKLTEAMIAWNARTNQIKAGPWPDTHGWSDRYTSTLGACCLDRHKMSPGMRLAMLFIDFHTITVRDGVPVEAAHRAFLAIDEYRKRISPDIPGAED